MRIRFSETAKKQLQSIKSYIARNNDGKRDRPIFTCEWLKSGCESGSDPSVAQERKIQ